MIWKVFLIVLIIFLCVRRWRLRKLIKLYNQLKSDLVSLPLIGHAHYFIGDSEGIDKDTYVQLSIRQHAFDKFSIMYDYDLLPNTAGDMFIRGNYKKLAIFYSNVTVRMTILNRLGREAFEKGGLTSYWIGDYLSLVIADPELLDILYKVFMEKGDMMRFIRRVTDNGSIFAPVPIWKPRRKILVPTFSPKNLDNFVDIFAKQSITMVKKLRKTLEKGPFSLWPFMTTYSMDSVCESTLGVTVKAQENPNHPFLLAFDEAARLVSNRILSPWTHNDVIFNMTPACKRTKNVKKVLAGFIEEIIKSKRESIQREINKTINEHSKVDNKGSLKTFLELLIESSGKSKGYTDIELTEEIMVLVMAGTDTSAAGACFTALMLASHRQVQEKVYEELKEVFGDSPRLVTADDLPRLTYLDAVIKETLRLYPPVPVIMRKADKDFTLPNGITIVKGVELMLSIWAMHRNPRYWGDDAEIFRPERFLDTPLKHPAQFTPFSYGPRNCVGYQYAMMSMKTALATLLRSYRILSDDAETEHVPYAFPETNEIHTNISQIEKGTRLRNVNVTHMKGDNNIPKSKATISLKDKHTLLTKSESQKSVGDETNEILDSRNNIKKHLTTPKMITSAKPLRVKFNIMMKDINNFTIQLETREKSS